MHDLLRAHDLASGKGSVQDGFTGRIRRAEHQNPCGVRRAGQPFALQTDGGQQSRYARVDWTDPGLAWPGAAGGQSL